MTNKEKFIQELENYISHETTIPFSEEAWDYFKQLKTTPEKEKAPFTENGAKVLTWMQQNYDKYNNVLKAKEIGEGLFCSSRTVSGSLRKLITDGYVSKIAGTPTCYSLTELGMTIEVIMPEKNEEEDS
jgi:DNA-binding MarR family transcriptional regulator